MLSGVGRSGCAVGEGGKYRFNPVGVAKQAVYRPGHSPVIRWRAKSARYLLVEDMKARYDAASAFWLHSEQNQNWCLPPGWTREAARGPKNVVK